MERPFLNRKGRDNSIFAGAIKSPCVAPIAERQKKKTNQHLDLEY